MRDALSTILLGAIVDDSNGLRARLLGLKEDSQGVVVVNVKPASVAAGAGLKPGDIIEEVNGRAVHNVIDLKSAIDYAAWPLRLLVNRYRRAIFMLLPKEMVYVPDRRGGTGRY